MHHVRMYNYSNCSLLFLDANIRVPYLSGSSYLIYPSFTQLTEIDITLHPSSPNGLVLYAENSLDDHFSLRLHNGFAVFQYRVGSVAVNITSAVNLAVGDWHMVTIGVNSTTSYITINNTYTSSSTMGVSTITIDSPLIVGGITSFSLLPSSVMANTGFTGCIRDLQVNSATVDVVMDALAGQGVSSCPEPVCSYVQCQNGGNCSAAEGGSGFVCHCPHGFGGTFCDTVLPLCSPNPCLYGGQCEEFGERMFTCRCPLLRAGRICEEGK